MSETYEKRLAKAVILQSFIDYYSDTDAITKRDAKNFLTSNVGEWKDSREMWCDMAGIQPEVITKALQDRRVIDCIMKGELQ